MKNQTTTVQSLKTEITKKLFTLGNKLDQFKKMELAIKTKNSLATVKRYMSGNEKQVCKLDLAEKLLIEGNALVK